MILVDANILMYAAGADHPNKQASIGLLEQIARGDVEAAIDTETLQEILHRYRHIRRWTDGKRVYDLARQVFAEIIPVSVEVLDRARSLMDEYEALTARDSVHAAVTAVHRLTAICSFDRDFDAIRGLRRIEPQSLL